MRIQTGMPSSSPAEPVRIGPAATIRARYDPLRNAVADRRPDVSAAAAIADGGEAGLQNVRRVARRFQRVELDALLELELPDIWLVAVIGEVRVGIDQARHDGEASDIDDARHRGRS